MKKFLFFACTFFFYTLNAQIINQVGGNIKNGATTKATDYNRTRSNKEKNDLNKTSPAPPTEDAKENEESSSNSDDATANSDFKTEYKFPSSLAYQYISYSEMQETERKEINYFFNDSVFMFRADQGYMINDYRISKMIIIDEDSKAGLATALTSPEIVKQTQSSMVLSMNFVKTGKTKQIGGFSCEEYFYKDPQNKQVSLWVSKENPFKDQSELLKSNIELFFMNMGTISPDANSVTMGIDMLNEAGQLESSFQFVGMKQEEKIINLAEYQITSY